MFSEKTTKIEKIFTDNLTVYSNRQTDGEDFVNFCRLFRKHELLPSLTLFILFHIALNVVKLFSLFLNQTVYHINNFPR